MGKAMGESSGMIVASPPKSLEKVISFCLPAPCRDVVLGDLQERYTSVRGYLLDALSVVPLVILSRMRRESDPQVLLIEGLVLTLSFMAAAWLNDSAFLNDSWALVQLAVPAAVALIVVLFADVYGDPTRSSRVSSLKAPMIGLALTLVLCDAVLRSVAGLTIPRSILVQGSLLSVFLLSGIRLLLSPVAERKLGPAMAGNLPEKWNGRPESRCSIPILFAFAGAILMSAVLGAWLGGGAVALTVPVLILIAACLLYRRDS
jgi:hypothetical protein